MSLEITGDYDDWRWAGSGVNPPGAVAPAVLTELATDEWHWVFSNNTIMAFPDQQISHDYKEGTDIVPHIHFKPTTTATYTGVFTMVFTGFLSGASGETQESPFTSTVTFDQAMTTDTEYAFDFADNISGTGRKISSVATITLKLSLTAGSGIALLGFDGHYLKDRLGSRQITAKEL
jgi:hypothetical protein